MRDWYRIRFVGASGFGVLAATVSLIGCSGSSSSAPETDAGGVLSVGGTQSSSTTVKATGGGGSTSGATSATSVLGSGGVTTVGTDSMGDTTTGGTSDGGASSSTAATSGGTTSVGGTTTTGGTSATGGGSSVTGVELTAALRFQKVNLRVVSNEKCATLTGSNLGVAACGATGQLFRTQILGPGYVAFFDDASGKCLTASSTGLSLVECSNVAAQQFSFSGDKTSGYKFASLGVTGSITATATIGSTAAAIQLIAAGAADPLAVVVDERPIGWATMTATIPVSDGAPPNGDEKTVTAGPTTGGGAWEAAKAKSYSNVSWFRASDFSTASTREAAITKLQAALKATGQSILVFEEGTYDFSRTTANRVNKCNAACDSGTGTYTESGGFCPADTTCATTSGCVVDGFDDTYRTLDSASDKTIIGLGAGATFRRLGMRFLNVRNVIYRNIAHAEMPGSVRAWDDGLLFWPADHVWVDHVSFSGFGRGAVVLSGTRVADGSSFYAYHDSGWMTFSWMSVDSRESWRCGGSENSPYPFFTTNDPSLSFHHDLFLSGHGRNPAIDGEGAHFFNVAWSQVGDGLDGRNGAKLLVEGSWFDGPRPIRMDDAVQPIVRAPFDAIAAGIKDARLLNYFSSAAMSSLKSDWTSRKLNINTLNTNAVATPNYPYSPDLDPSTTLATVNAGAGAGKGGFPKCTLSNATTKAYTCD